MVYYPVEILPPWERGKGYWILAVYTTLSRFVYFAGSQAERGAHVQLLRWRTGGDKVLRRGRE